MTEKEKVAIRLQMESERKSIIVKLKGCAYPLTNLKDALEDETLHEESLRKIGLTRVNRVIKNIEIAILELKKANAIKS